MPSSLESSMNVMCSVISLQSELLQTRGGARTAIVPADQNASGFLIQSSFYALLPSLLCRLAGELFYGHLWIWSQLIYSQRVTSDMLFQLATNNHSSDPGKDGGGVSEGFGSLLKPVKTSLFASPSPLGIAYLPS